MDLDTDLDSEVITSFLTPLVTLLTPVTTYLPSFLQPYYTSFLTLLSTSPLFTLLRILITLLLFTRGASGLRARLQGIPSKSNSTKPRTIPQIPHWIPWLGNWIEFTFTRQDWLLGISLGSEGGTDVFSLLSAGTEVVVVVGKTMQDEVLQLASSRGDDGPDTGLRDHLALQRARNVFQNRSATNQSCRAIEESARLCLHSDNGRMALRAQLEQNIYDLISGNTSLVDQATWERVAGIQQVTTNPLKLNASLPLLITQFSLHVLLSSLLGKSFVEQNSTFVTDFFNFGTKYHFFLAGLPYQLTPTMGPAAQGRARCLNAIEGLVMALRDVDKAKGKEGDRGGMSFLLEEEQVNPTLRKMVQVMSLQSFQSGSAASERSERKVNRDIASVLLEILWRCVWKPGNLVFWCIMYIFSDRVLVTELRKEVESAGLIQVVRPSDSELALKEAPRMKFTGGSIDSRFLREKVPLLWSIVRETCRLELEESVTLGVTRNIVLEPQPDRRTKEARARYEAQAEKVRKRKNVAKDEAGKSATQLVTERNLIEQAEAEMDDEPRVQKWQFKKGQSVYVPMGVRNRDAGLFQEPDEFDGKRYLSTKEGEGLGSGGREIDVDVALIVAAIVTMFTLRPDTSDINDKFVHPGSRIVADVGTPKKDVRARIVRRVG